MGPLGCFVVAKLEIAEASPITGTTLETWNCALRRRRAALREDHGAAVLEDVTAS
jgi:hypothetical protein